MILMSINVNIYRMINVIFYIFNNNDIGHQVQNEPIGNKQEHYVRFYRLL